MSSLNRVQIIGNVGQDPEIRTLNSGDKVVNLTLATSEKWKDKMTGETKEKTEWHKVVVFNDNMAKVIEQWVKKGSKIMIEGSLQTRKWTDQQGVEKYTTEIVVKAYGGNLILLGGKQDGQQGGGQSSGGHGGGNGGYAQGGTSSPQQQQRYGNALGDDEVPF